MAVAVVHVLLEIARLAVVKVRLCGTRAGRVSLAERSPNEKNTSRAAAIPNLNAAGFDARRRQTRPIPVRA